MSNAWREILIEELEGSIWVAAMGQDSRLAGIEVDPATEEVRWGSIYWAKVARIDKALDAAYIALDGKNIGVLHNADVRIRRKNGTITKGGEKDIGKYIQPGQMIAVQAKTAYLPQDEDEHTPDEEKRPLVTMNIALPGRYMIYTPLADENRVSQRVRDKTKRKRLQDMLDSLPDVRGCILRASSTDTQTEFLVRETKILDDIWKQIQTHFEGDRPDLIMLGPDAVQRTLSDQAIHHISSIRVTTLEHLQMAQDWCDIFAPDLMTKIEAVKISGADDEFALFDYADVITQIEGVLQPYTILPSGAAIIIQDTAAVTAIDINRGADNRSNLAINLDCAWEIARQLVLRNMGGAMVIDFLKVNNKEDQKKIIKHMENWVLTNDPCTVQIHGFTALGLLEVTRQRRTPPLMERYRSTIS